MPDDAFHAIEAAFGTGWEVVRVAASAVSDGDGAAASPAAVDAACGAEVYVGWGVPAAVVQAASGTLKWAHTAAAGAGASVTPALRASAAVLTNSRGVHAEPMADWIITAIGMWARGFIAAAAAQRERRWAKDAFTNGAVPLHELSQINVGLVGLGGIGTAVARRAVALGMTVRGVRRHPEQGSPPGVSWVGGPDQLETLAARSNVLVIAAPHTAGTRRLVDAAVLAALPAGACVINVARGVLLDEGALLMQLEEGHLGAAVLDVFATEPLPSDHPLWRHPKVTLTPHVSAVSEQFWQRETALIVENARHYLASEPLRNVVNLGAGY